MNLKVFILIENDMVKKGIIFISFSCSFSFLSLQENIQILRDLSLLQIQMRDLEGYRV